MPFAGSDIFGDFGIGQMFHDDFGRYCFLAYVSAAVNQADGSNDAVRPSRQQTHNGCLCRIIGRLLDNFAADDDDRVGAQNIFAGVGRSGILRFRQSHAADVRQRFFAGKRSFVNTGRAYVFGEHAD